MSTGLLRMTLVFGSSFCLIIQTVPLPFHTGTTRLVLIIPSVILCRNKIKCHLETCYGEWVMRIPAWIKWATQEWDEVQYNGVYWDPPEVGAPGEVDPDKKYTFKFDESNVTGSHHSGASICKNGSKKQANIPTKK